MHIRLPAPFVFSIYVLIGRHSDYDFLPQTNFYVNKIPPLEVNWLPDLVISSTIKAVTIFVMVFIVEELPHTYQLALN